MRLPGKPGRTLNGEDMASKRTRKMNNPSAESPDLPLYLFHQGTNYRAYKYFGAHFNRKESCVVFRLVFRKGKNRFQGLGAACRRRKLSRGL